MKKINVTVHVSACLFGECILKSSVGAIFPPCFSEDNYMFPHYSLISMKLLPFLSLSGANVRLYGFFTHHFL